MFGGIFDSIIILIPIAIIIGRFVAQARNKRKPPPPPPPPIPVHFEDDVDDRPVVRKVVKNDRPAIPMLESDDLFCSQSFLDNQRSASAIRTEKKVYPVPQAQSAYKKPAEVKKVLPLPEIQKQDDFFLKLGKLSQLKQAVVMAEVLGPPKALQ